MRFIVLLFSLAFSFCSFARQTDSLLARYRAFPDDSVKVNKLYQKGFELRLVNVRAAIEFSNECLKAAAKLHDPYYFAKALNLAGILLYQTGNYKKAKEYHFNALVLRKQIADTFGEARSLVNLGLAYRELNKDLEALNCTQKALEIFKRLKNKNEVRIALNNIASLQVKMNYFEEAKGNLETLKAWAEQEHDHRAMAVFYTNLGTCLYNLHDTLAAEEYYLMSLQERDLSENVVEQADSYLNLAEVYLDKKIYAKADSCLKKALRISEENNYSEGLVPTWKLYSRYHSARGNFKDAYFYLSKHDSALANKPGEVSETEFFEEPNFKDAFPKVKDGTKIFQIIVIGILIVVLTLILIRHNHEQKEKEG